MKNEQLRTAGTAVQPSLKPAKILSRRDRMGRPLVDVLLIVATVVELEAVLVHLRPLTSRRGVLTLHCGSSTYHVGRYGAYGAAVVMAEVGSVRPGSAPLVVFEAITRFRPRAVIAVGIAFGRDPARQVPGDVLVSEQLAIYEPERVGARTISRGPKPMGGPTLRNRFRNVQGWLFERLDGSVCAIRIGEILSGEKLVDHKPFRDALFRKYPNAIGGEMEGAGLYAAAEQAKVEWILVKGICDFADGRKTDEHQPLAAAAAASLVAHVLRDSTALHGLDRARAQPFSSVVERLRSAGHRPARAALGSRGGVGSERARVMHVGMSVPADAALQALVSRVAQVRRRVRYLEWHILIKITELTTLTDGHALPVVEISALLSKLQASEHEVRRQMEHLHDLSLIDTDGDHVSIVGLALALRDAASFAGLEEDTFEMRRARFEETITAALSDELQR